MNIIRKIKLNSLGCYNFKPEENDLIEFVKDNLLGLKLMFDKKVNNNYYVNNNDREIIRYCMLYNDLYINYALIWNKFKTKFKLDDSDIEILMKDIVVKCYNIKIINNFYLL